MIIKQESQNFTEENLIMILNGLPGVGKTTLAFSAPDVLLIDFDKGVKRTKPEHRKDIISISSYDELLNDIRNPQMKNYKTVVFDTCGQFIDLLKEWAAKQGYAKKDGSVSLQGFGVVKQEFLRFSSEIKKTHNIIYLFHTLKEKDQDGNPVYDLMCEGATKQTVWIPTDVGAYMEIINGERKLHFAPSQFWSAKKSYGISDTYSVPTLKEGQANDFLESLFAQIKENIQSECESMYERKKIYQTAVAEGIEIVNSINTAEDAERASVEMKKIIHALTSEAEVKDSFRKHIAELGISWDKAGKKWVQNS